MVLEGGELGVPGRPAHPHLTPLYGGPCAGGWGGRSGSVGAPQHTACPPATLPRGVPGFWGAPSPRPATTRAQAGLPQARGVPVTSPRSRFWGGRSLFALVCGGCWAQGWEQRGDPVQLSPRGVRDPRWAPGTGWAAQLPPLVPSRPLLAPAELDSPRAPP